MNTPELEKDSINAENSEADTNTPEQEKTDNVPESGKPEKKEKKASKLAGKINKRALKHGSMATAITIIFIVGVVLVNLIVAGVNDVYPLKLDLTENSNFQVSQETIDYVQGIQANVEITVLAEKINLAQSQDGKQISEIIDRYAQYSDNISVTYLDADKNPEIVSNLNALYKGDLSSKLVVVRSGDRVQALGQDDLLQYMSNQQTGEYKVSSTAEQAVTSAVMFVTDANPVKVTVLTGGSTQDSDVTGFTDVLTANGYLVEEQDALTGVIDPETDLLIVNSPMLDFTSDQVNKISTFLDNEGKFDKHMIYIASINQKETPNIDAFMAEYGLKVGSGYTLDTNLDNMTTLGRGLYGIYSFPTNESYTKNMANAALPVVVTQSRPVEVLFDAKGDRLTEIILSTEDTATVVPMNEGEVKVDDLPKQTVNLVALGSKRFYEGTTLHMSTVTAIGSPFLLNSTFLSQPSLNNADYMLSVVNTLTGKSETFQVLSKDLTPTTFEITQAQAINIRNVVQIGIPIAIMLLGIVVWVRRRYR